MYQYANTLALYQTTSIPINHGASSNIDRLSIRNLSLAQELFESATNSYKTAKEAFSGNENAPKNAISAY